MSQRKVLLVGIEDVNLRQFVVFIAEMMGFYVISAHNLKEARKTQSDLEVSLRREMEEVLVVFDPESRRFFREDDGAIGVLALGDLTSPQFKSLSRRFPDKPYLKDYLGELRG